MTLNTLNADPEQHIALRYSSSKNAANSLNNPYLRYIVPFSYGQDDKTYQEVKDRLIKHTGWRIATRADIAPSREEDLYNHIYEAFLDDETTDSFDTNAGIMFIPVDEEAAPRAMLYSFSSKKKKKKYEFFIRTCGIFLFKTGVGFYVYESILPVHKNLPADSVYVPSLSLNELIIFQNRFKELNIVRGYLESGDNQYRIIPARHEEDDFYTIGSEIAEKLRQLFGDVFYYPARVNVILKEREKRKLSEEWDRIQKDYESRGVTPDQKKYIKRHNAILAKKDYWNNLSIAEAQQLENIEGPKIAPDKALLFSYVVMNSPENLAHAQDVDAYFYEYLKSAYYLTRGYKESYRVASDVKKERAEMFERHENDYWDASLEGVGNFIFLYENAYNKAADGSVIQNYNQFFDTIRAKEMRGDYFLLYILLLYQHYSIVYLSQKISETIPMNGALYDDRRKKTQAEVEIRYEKLRALKNTADTFFASSMYEAVSQITDLCRIYNFIEERLQIKRNGNLLKQGLDSINMLLAEKASEKEERLRSRIEIFTSLIGLFAVISIVTDTLDLISVFGQGNPLPAIIVSAVIIVIFLIAYFMIIKKR